MMDCASHHDLLNYYTKSGSLLSGIDVPHAALICTNPNCPDEAHLIIYNAKKSFCMVIDNKHQDMKFSLYPSQ